MQNIMLAHLSQDVKQPHTESAPLGPPTTFQIPRPSQHETTECRNSKHFGEASKRHGKGKNLNNWIVEGVLTLSTNDGATAPPTDLGF